MGLLLEESIPISVGSITTTELLVIFHIKILDIL